MTTGVRMFSRSLIILALVWSLVFLALLGGQVLGAGSLSETELAREVKAVESNLMCQCGCTMVVVSCDCEWANKARTDIRARLEAGATRQEVLAGYVKTYGEKALSAPTKQGFNLSAWILPFAAIAVGAGVVYVVLRNWVLAKQDSDPEGADPGSGVSRADVEKYKSRLDDEMKRYL